MIPSITIPALWQNNLAPPAQVVTYLPSPRQGGDDLIAFVGGTLGGGSSVNFMV